jgi:trehalose 6-phosphate synthase
VRDDIVIASNRGPVSFTMEADGSLRETHGAGGLASALGPLLQSTGATWIAAAMDDADRAVAAQGAIDAGGFRYRVVALDPTVYAEAYATISNTTIWFLHHRLWDLARLPTFDPAWRQAWDGYRTFNRTIAEVIAAEAPDDATVLVQDYHLSLVAPFLAKQRPDLRTVYFHHIPHCPPEELATLPPDIAVELLEGLAANHACGFHTRRWAAAFEACCEDVLGRRPNTFVAPLGPDAANFESLVSSDECIAAAGNLSSVVGERRMILRVDRMEPAKNVLRGVLAFDALLGSRPDLVGTVVFVALVYPSRQSIAAYAAYRRDVEQLVDAVNRRWSAPEWTPILLDSRDDFVRSVAALQRYDVLLVNSIRDGLNLVAKEGPMLNRTDGVLVLSTETGAFDELGSVALPVHPFDVTATAAQLAAALDMAPTERRERAVALRTLATARTPRDWLADQLGAAR